MKISKSEPNEKFWSIFKKFKNIFFGLVKIGFHYGAETFPRVISLLRRQLFAYEFS